MEHIVEPYRLSLLDVLKRNLKAANRVTYVHRIIYVCSHTFPNYRTAYDFYQKLVKSIEEKYLEERVTGLLLYYPDYFCSILESSERGIHRVLEETAAHPDIRRFVQRRKLLAVCHNINQRFLEEWMIYTDKPPTLLEKIELDVDRQTAMRYVYNCIKKLYGLVLKLRPNTDEDRNSYDENSKRISVASVSLQNPARLRLTDFLPEYSLLDFLLKTEHTEELKNYHLVFGHVPEAESYHAMVWPPIPSYVPFNVFDSFQDPIQDLPPRELIKLKEIEVPQVKRKSTIE